MSAITMETAVTTADLPPSDVKHAIKEDDDEGEAEPIYEGMNETAAVKPETLNENAAVEADAEPPYQRHKPINILFADRQRARDETTDDGISPYMMQRRHFYTDEKWALVLKQLSLTKSVYVGNLSFYTNEEQLYEFFSQCGRVTKVIMGLNQLTMTPCGFAFVEFATHAAAAACQRHLSGTMCDERSIRADLDVGFEEGRQFGRSKFTGGQTRDDFRKTFDAGRGGYVIRQTNTFMQLNMKPSLGSELVRILPPKNRYKKQRIDLAAVRAYRDSRLGESEADTDAADAELAGQPRARLSGSDHKVGSKRRHEDSDEEFAGDEAEDGAEPGEDIELEADTAEQTKVEL